MHTFKIRITAIASDGPPDSVAATVQVSAPDALSAIRPFIDAANDLRPHGDDDHE